MKRKKSTIIRHRLNEDCKVCIRERLESEPIIRDLREAEGFTTLQLRNSIAYLRKFTSVYRFSPALKMLSEAEPEVWKMLDEYLEDVGNILTVFEDMKNLRPNKS